MINHEKSRKRSLIKKKFLLAFLFVCAWMLTGCSVFQFQAKKYVRCELNALCKDDLEPYMKITDETQEAVEEGIERSLQLEAEAFAAYFGVDALSDQTVELLKEFSRQVFSYGKYKVKHQKKTKNGYEVTVTVYPLLFHELAEEETEEYIKKFNQKAEDSEFLYLSDASYQEEFVKGLLEVYEEELDSISYGDALKITVEIKKKGNYTYTADLSEVEDALIAFE